MRRAIVLIAMLMAWLVSAAQSADPHMYMRAEVGTRGGVNGDDGLRGVQFGAEGGVKLFNCLSFGLAMDYYTTKLNADFDVSVNTIGYPGENSVYATFWYTEYQSLTNFSGRVMVAYDVLSYIPGNRWVSFSPEVGFGLYRESEMAYKHDIDGDSRQETVYVYLNDHYNLEFTTGARLDVKLPKGWAVGLFARYHSGSETWPAGLAVTKTF